MATSRQLKYYLANTRALSWRGRLIGTEIETFFANRSGSAISMDQSQDIMRGLFERGWKVESRKAHLITEVTKDGSRVLYELGYPNMELSVAPGDRTQLLARTHELLGQLYASAEATRAYPVFAPIYPGTGEYFAIPDERDAAWITLDGRAALGPLARISAVQFTVDTSPSSAIDEVNALNARREAFLSDYPQDLVWREYIRISTAGYRPDRYGGPCSFDSLDHYCDELAKHDVVKADKLVPFEKATLIQKKGDIDLFLRSVWWYFRLRLYKDALCIEARPMPRRGDGHLVDQMRMVLDTIG